MGYQSICVLGMPLCPMNDVRSGFGIHVDSYPVTVLDMEFLALPNIVRVTMIGSVADCLLKLGRVPPVDTIVPCTE